MEKPTPEVIEINTKYEEPINIESMCPNCEKNGETRMMLTNIPFFKDVLVVSFSCEICGHRNNEIQNAGVLADTGLRIKLTVTCKDDLERDICRGEFATTFVPELGLEVPFNKKGAMSTLEGFLTVFKEDLEMQQPYRRVDYF